MFLGECFRKYSNPGLRYPTPAYFYAQRGFCFALGDLRSPLSLCLGEWDQTTRDSFCIYSFNQYGFQLSSDRIKDYESVRPRKWAVDFVKLDELYQNSSTTESISIDECCVRFSADRDDRSRRIIPFEFLRDVESIPTLFDCLARLHSSVLHCSD